MWLRNDRRCNTLWFRRRKYSREFRKLFYTDFIDHCDHIMRPNVQNQNGDSFSSQQLRQYSHTRMFLMTLLPRQRRISDKKANNSRTVVAMRNPTRREKLSHADIIKTTAKRLARMTFYSPR